MRSRVPLALIEQTVMLLVFAVAAALCLLAFAHADNESEHMRARDCALVRAQSAAEILKNCRGDCAAAAERCGGMIEGGIWCIRYDENWQRTDGGGHYVLCVTPEESDVPLLGRASVEVFAQQECLASLELAWQEVGK